MWAHDHIVGHAHLETRCLARPGGVRLTPTRAVARGLRVTLGVALLAATFLPAQRLLDPALTGLAGAVTRQVAEVSWSGALWGTLMVVLLAVVLARWLPALDIVGIGEAAARRLERIDGRRFVALCAGLAFVLSLMASLAVLRGLPSSVDEMVQLLHARILLGGRTALPLPDPAAAWIVQNSVVTPSGWASIYPPFHTLVLALGLAVGVPWLVGPVMTGTGAGLVAASFDRLLPGRRPLARVAALLCAVSPFLLFLGGTELSHTTAAALAALTLWTALRARDGVPAWALLTGLAVGAFVSTRPWTGMVVSAALVGTVWVPEARRRAGGARWLATRAVATLAGGAPFAVLLLGWDRALFGGPFVLGYSAAFGPAHGLGFHRDPWGNVYGLREAVAYTGADLSLLGAVLLESPLPALAVVGAGLTMARALDAGERVLVAWATAGVAANFVYWHHGIHMGPRFLFETGAAWVGLWVVGLFHLARGPGGPFVHRAVGWAAALCVVAAPFLAVERGLAYRVPTEIASVARLPDPPVRPALVFVHGSWSSRSAARLVAAGMRRDSVETALRRNAACAVDAYARWRSAGAPPPAPSLDLESRPGPGPGLAFVELSPGNQVAVRPGAPADSVCTREARSDRLGTLELEPLLWQAPPLPGRKLVVARDLGPETDARALRSFPGYHPYVAVDGGPGRPPRLLEYHQGMELLWGSPQ
jgi:hypothetical protein